MVRRVAGQAGAERVEPDPLCSPRVGTSSLSFGLLGTMTVASEAGRIDIRGAVRRRLLARLLISANRPVPVDRLKEDLWEGDPPASAASTLKSHVSLLRASLGPGRLSYADGCYVLTVSPDELDVFLFEREATAGHEMLRQGDALGAATTLGGALARWRGAALADVAGTTWGEPEAVRLEEMRAAAVEGWLAARLAAGETHAVIADAEAAVSAHPLREASWAKLITALYLSGRQAEALRAYQRLRELLGEELGIAPSRELVLLEGAILRQDLEIAPAAGRELAAAAAAAAAGADAGVAAGAGADRLEGGAVPGPGGAPVNAPASNLPRELTSFVPRPAELAAVAALVAEPGLVTLTGAGGTGKTRLALRAAAEAEVAYDAVWLCELAAIDDPADVVRELASAVGYSDREGVDLAVTVAQRLAEGSNLMVLDNCEHLLDASAAVAARLLREAPQLRLLATSRSPLGVVGEVVHRVPSMSVPDEESGLSELLGFESVRLFVERAKSQQAGFALNSDNCGSVASICVRLDGIPLALELAAARMRVMSLADIESRLDDRFRLLTSGARTSPPRQQTLELLIDWSYDLLDEPERAVFATLAVFAGGFDLSAAESVSSPETVAQSAVLDIVASLVDKSLLQVDTSGVTARYRMLESVRAYAADKLAATGGENARAAHAAHFLRLVELAAPHFSGSSQLSWRARLEQDDDNLRLAFANLIAAGTSEEALRFGSAVSRFWNSRGFYGDEVDLLGAALERPDAAEPTPARGAALAAAGYLMFRRGSGASAIGYLEEALRIADLAGSQALRADALRTMAWLADRRGEPAAAAALAHDAVDAARASGQTHLIARAYDVRAAASQQHDPESARRDYAEALRCCRADGDGLGQASALNNLGVLDLEQGDMQAARSRFAAARAIAEGVKDAALIPFLEYGVGLAACLDGDYEGAEPAFASALMAARRTGQRSLVAYAVLGAAAVRAATGREPEAAVLLGASSALFEALGEQPERIEVIVRDRATASLRAALGDRFEAAIGNGQQMTAAEAVQFAVERL
jgi:predicted ATPase/DNA-binding SARP family transcriptional activator